MIFTFSCNKKALEKKQDAVIITIDDLPIHASEFRYAYEKNRKKDSSLYQEESIREYLELFTNFKLKVKDAEALQMDTNPSFIKELENYKQQLARPYLSDEEYIEELVNEAYNRKKEEIKASHILLKVASDASSQDTLKLYQKIAAIRDSIMHGSLTFEQAALKYSEDPSVKINKGNLGYFSVLRMVYAFESACYNTPKGQISKIVRTSYGYHILKVFDRRKAKGQITVKHIMTSKDNKQANEKINTIYTKLIEGADWDQLCKESSEHGATKLNGGLLKPFTTGGIGSHEFETAAYALQHNGDFSKPVKTQYGYHIIKLIKKDSLQSFEESKEELTKKIKKNERSQLAKEKMVNKLIEQNGIEEFALYEDKAVLNELDSLVHSSKWNIDTDSKIKEKTVFMIGDSSYPIRSFYQFVLSQKNSFKQKDFQLRTKQLYNQFKNNQIIAYEMEQLPKKHPEYKRIVNEYREGIMLFDLMNKKVWKKANSDTVALKQYYEDHIQNYFYKQRAEVIRYTSTTKKMIEKITSLYAEGKTTEEVNEFMKTTSQDLRSEKIIYEKDHKDTPEEFVFEQKDQLISHKEGYKYIKVEKILAPSKKEFKKVKGLVISDYQKDLEKNWIAQLRDKHTVQVNEVTVQQLIKK